MANDFERVAGDGEPIVFTVTDEDTGAAVDITGLTFTYSIVDRSDTVVFSTTTGTVGGDDSNELTIEVDAADTEGLDGVYFHELKFWDGDGAVHTPVDIRSTVRFVRTKGDATP